MVDHDAAIPAMPTAVATVNHCGPLALSATSSGLDVETQGSPEAGNVITPRPRLVRPMGEEMATQHPDPPTVATQTPSSGR